MPSTAPRCISRYRRYFSWSLLCSYSSCCDPTPPISLAAMWSICNRAVRAIWVEAAENTDEVRFSPGERYAKTYEINMLRCIFCGYCEDACPTEAIVLEHDYRLTFTNRRDSIYTKDMLLVPPPTGAQDTPQQVAPGEYPRSIPEMENPL